MGDTTSRDALERSLCARLLSCAHDELRVLDAILLRLELGRDRYGALDLARDRRDWAREEAEEHVDALVYRACALISRQDEERRELRDAAGRELVEAGLVELAEVTTPREREHDCDDPDCQRCHHLEALVSLPRTPAVDFAFDHSEPGEDFDPPELQPPPCTRSRS